MISMRVLLITLVSGASFVGIIRTGEGLCTFPEIPADGHSRATVRWSSGSHERGLGRSRIIGAIAGLYSDPLPRVFLQQDTSTTRLVVPPSKSTVGPRGIGESSSVFGRILSIDRYQPLKLDRTPSGYRCVTARVADRDVRLILDTGSPATKLDRNRTAHLALEWWKPGGRSKTARLLLTEPPSHWRCDLPMIQVGPVRAEKLPIVHIDLGEFNRGIANPGDKPADGLLGADILDRGEAIIDYRSNTLYLRSQE
jgi:hypothetical protein